MGCGMLFPLLFVDVLFAVAVGSAGDDVWGETVAALDKPKSSLPVERLLEGVFSKVHIKQVERVPVTITGRILEQDSEPGYHKLMARCEARSLQHANKQREALIVAPDPDLPRFRHDPKKYIAPETRRSLVMVPASLTANQGVVVRIDARWDAAAVPVNDTELTALQRSTVRVDALGSTKPLVLAASVVAGRHPGGGLQLSAVLDCSSADGLPSEQQEFCTDAVAESAIVHRALVTFSPWASCCGHECACPPELDPQPTAQFVVCSKARQFSLTMLKTTLRAPYSKKELQRAVSGLCSLGGTAADADADAKGVPVAATEDRRRRLLSNMHRRHSSVYSVGSS